MRISKRDRYKRVTKKERLAEALVAVYTTDAKEREAMRHLVITCASVFRSGDGLVFSEADELLNALYDEEEVKDG